MKNYKKEWVSLICVLAASAIHVQAVTDDFDRADTVSSNDLSVAIGSDWVSANDPYATAMIASNQVLVTGSGGTSGGTAKFTALNTAAGTLNENGNSFEISVDTVMTGYADTNAALIGLCFNWQDSLNYYQFRYGGGEAVQFVRVLNGSGSAVAGNGQFNVSSGIDRVDGRTYRMTVSSTNAYEFTFTIRDLETGLIVFYQTATDNTASFKNGSGGIYSTIASGGAGTASFDNFSLTNAVIYSSTVTADSFDRAETATSTNLAESIGSDWFNGDYDPIGAAYITTNGNVDVTTAKLTMLNSAAETVNDGEDVGFRLSGVVQLDHTSSSAFGGLVFHYQNPSNFYQFRFNSIGTAQIVRFVDGVGRANNGLLSQAGAFSIVQNHAYKLVVESMEAYTFTVSVLDAEADDKLLFTSTNTDTNSVRFTDGYAGFFDAASATCTFDDFRFVALSAGMTARGTPHAWLDQYGLVTGGDYEAADLADADGDGHAAWEEYRAGTDPTSASSVLALSGSTAAVAGQYVISWPVVSGKAYRLLSTTNLVSGSWTTNAAGLQGDSELAYTNAFEDSLFYKIEIE